MPSRAARAAGAAGEQASYHQSVELAALPGSELILAGIGDLRSGRRTAAALLVAVGADRLRTAGLDVPPIAVGRDAPEHQLYELLALTEPDAAHGRYNALIRRLVSFERALERAQAG